MLRRCWMSTLALAGCLGAPDGETATEPGYVHLCLASSAAPQPTDTGRYRRVGVSGVVTATERRTPALPEALVPCFADRGRFLQITDDDGVLWQLGWSASASSDDVDLTPGIAIGTGERVTVDFLVLNDFANDAAVVVRDATGVILAAEEGYDGTLDEADPGLLPELVVSRGNALGTFYRSDCGRRVTDAIVVDDGTSRQALGVWVEATVPVDDRPLQVRNVGAWHFVDGTDCLDAWGPAPWILWWPFENR